MAYNNPSAHEKRIGPKLQTIAKKLQRLFVRETGAEVDFILVVNSKAARQQQASGAGVPAGMYVASMDRTSSALCMAEMLAKWQLSGLIPPINELEDANGNKLSDILAAFEPGEVQDSGDTEGGVH